MPLMAWLNVHEGGAQHALNKSWWSTSSNQLTAWFLFNSKFEAVSLSPTLHSTVVLSFTGIISAATCFGVTFCHFNSYSSLICHTCLSRDSTCSPCGICCYSQLLFLFPFSHIILEIIFLWWLPIQFSPPLPAATAVIFNFCIPICFCKCLILALLLLWSGPFWALPCSRVNHCTIYVSPSPYFCWFSFSFSKFIWFSNCHCTSLLPFWATRWYSFSKDKLISSHLIDSFKTQFSHWSSWCSDVALAQSARIIVASHTGPTIRGSVSSSLPSSALPYRGTFGLYHPSASCGLERRPQPLL